jgi:hypothetical protein
MRIAKDAKRTACDSPVVCERGRAYHGDAALDQPQDMKGRAPMKRLIMMCGCLLTVALGCPTVWGASEDRGGFNGLELNLGNLSRLSAAQSRSISPESFTGEKGKAGMATEGTGRQAASELGRGWKVSPSVRITAKSTFTMAQINGSGAIQQIWMTPAPIDKMRFFILRCYWDG